MRFLPTLFLGLLPLLLPPGSPSLYEKGPDEEGLHEEALEVLPPAAVRVRWFRLEVADPAEGERDVPLGLLRWVSGHDAGRGELFTELEWTLFEPRTRITHVETLEEGERKLVFRERRPRSGRTLVVAGNPRAGYRSVETTGGDLFRRELAEAGQLSLLLLEAARQGLELPARSRLFEPLSGTFQTRYPRVEEAPDGLRTLRLYDAEGRTRARHRFQGTEPVELRFSEEGPRALAVSRREYERLLRVYESQDPDADPDAEGR